MILRPPLRVLEKEVVEDKVAARVSASQAIRERAYGKAPTLNTSDPTAIKRAIDMTDDELAAIAAGAKLTLVKSDT